MKLYALLITVLFIGMFLITSSCELPTTTGLNLTVDSSGDDDDDKKEDVKPTPECGSRDSCDDTCDEMFYGQSERLKCSRLNFDEVNALVNVHDELKEVIDKDDLEEDVNADDFEQYLSIGMDSLIRRIEGEFDDDTNDDKWESLERQNNSLELLSWIAENEDIAQIVLAQDTRFEMARELFKNIHYGPSRDRNVAIIGQTYTVTGGRGVFNAEADGIVISSKGIHEDQSSSTNPPTSKSIISFRRNNNDVPSFVDGFIRERSQFSDDSFIKFAIDERNDSAFEWAHNALVDLCMDATNEDKDDVEVKQCILAVYCTHRAVEHQYSAPSGDATNYRYKSSSGGTNRLFQSTAKDVTGDGIFDELEDKESIVGRVGDPEDLCQAHASDEGLYDEDRIEDLFE